MPTTATRDEFKSIYHVAQARVTLAKQRQTAVLRGEVPDNWPIIMYGELTAEQERLPKPNMLEVSQDPDLMLAQQLRSACLAANSGSDSVPSMRANLGCGIFLACLGLEQEVFADKMPWMQQHLTPEEAKKLTFDDIKIQGSFARGLEMMEHFKAVMGDNCPDVFCMDGQGPFDLAHLLLGDEIFYLVHDDPGLAHHVLEICLELSIRANRWMKEVTGEPLNHQAHSNRIYGENLGVRICEDTSAVVGPSVIDEFSIPYTRRLAQAFGGAWVHYCGRNDHLTRQICQIPEVRGVHFGHVPGHEQDHIFFEDMQLIKNSGKVYVGTWPYLPGEDVKSYFRRLHQWAEQGAVIPDIYGNPTDAAKGGFRTVPEAAEFWYGLKG